MFFCTIWCENGLFYFNGINSKTIYVFFIGTIGDITVQLSFIFPKRSEQIESIFSYGMAKIRTSLCLATVELSVPVMVPLIFPNACFAACMYSDAASAAL